MDSRAELKLEFRWDLPQGVAHACDSLHRLIAEIQVPQEKPPAGTAILALSIEDYIAATRAMGCGPEIATR